MRNFKICTLLLFVFAAVPAYSTAIDFSKLNGPTSITNSPYDLNGVTFNYVMTDQYPVTGGLAPVLPCAFDGTTGYQLAAGGNCVGAQIDPDGLYGTTDGLYIIQFSTLFQDFTMSFGIGTNLPDEDVADQKYGVDAFFANSFNGSQSALTSDLQAGQLTYNHSLFDTVYLYFRPSTVIADNALFGESIVGAYDIGVTAVPEPASMVLIGLGLALLGSLRMLKRKS